MEMTGEPMQLLRRTIGGYARHPNFAAVLIIGLGCERNQLALIVCGRYCATLDANRQRKRRLIV